MKAVNDDILSSYLKDINKIPLLSQEEETELAKKLRLVIKRQKMPLLKQTFVL